MKLFGGDDRHTAKKVREYQREFSKLHPNTMFDQTGRLQKARKTVAILLHAARAADIDPHRAKVLDIGCSTGILTRHYAEHFGAVVGVDIDDGAIEWARQNMAAPSIDYRVGDSMALPFDDASFDVVTCTHIYEHVPDAQKMIYEIERVLCPGGICFFAAENRIRFWDGHYNLPLLSILPKPAAHLYLRLAGRGRRFYETHRTLWGLRKMVRRFEVVDYTVAAVRNPGDFAADDVIRPGSLMQRFALTVLRVAYWASPTYLWVLRKPGKPRER